MPLEADCAGRMFLWSDWDAPFDSPNDAFPERRHLWGERQSRRFSVMADGFADFGTAGKLLTRGEARRIAANIAKLPKSPRR